jgi:hypothetical protein
MIDLYLFEIKCAEEIGDFRLADALDKKLVRIAKSDHKDILRKITRKTKSDAAVEDVSFSKTRQKFVVKAKPSLNDTLKRKIKDLAGPYSVSFRYSNKNIDELMSGVSEDPIKRHLDKLKQLGPDYVGLDKFNDMEPTDEDLRFTAEFPAENSSNDALDEFLLEYARKNMRSLPGY